ncbi:hypothetical protein MN116_006187 [Schistosoma mekongi]|uniref:F-box domain-containing protein n=1 Tax=Schistosoma mekongi TaxID=38744 RepID=A0AAE1ZBV7_SCHME|nr:hypothetical protein MN116_006187 [Schistosoma mekongi]
MYPIPVEILIYIFRQLDVNDLENCSFVCKQWNTLTNDLCLWLPKCYEKLQKCQWIDVHLMTSLQLCGIYDMKIFLEKHTVHSKNKLHFKSGYYMRKFYYHLHFLSNENCTLQSQVNLYPNENIIVYHKCIMIGPAMDSSNINGSLINHVMNWSIWNQLPDDFIIPDPYLGRKTKLVGKNIMIQLPKSSDSLPSTLVKMTCIVPQNGEFLQDKSRISGEYLLNYQENDCSIHKGTLLPEINVLLRDCHLIIYTIDIRKSVAIFLEWEQITKEIVTVLNGLNAHQSLLIIGSGDKNGKEECITLVDLVNKLQAIFFIIPTTDTSNEQHKLKIPIAQWRVWMTTSNGVDYDNIVNMINWGLCRSNNNS